MLIILQLWDYMETLYNCTQLYQFMKEILWFCPALLKQNN